MPQFDDVASDNLKTARSKHAEAMTDAQIERHFRSHPELKPGRDYRANTMRFQVGSEQIGDRFDETFSGSPDVSRSVIDSTKPSRDLLTRQDGGISNSV